MFQNWIRVSNLINDMVPNNKHYASSPEQGFSLIPDTLLLLFPPPLCSVFLAFSSPFNHIPSGLSCCLEWGRDGRRKGMPSVQMHPSRAPVALFRLRVWSLPINNLGSRFWCYFWGKEGRGDVKNKGSMPSSPFHTHRPLGSTSKIQHLVKLKPWHKVLKQEYGKT